MDVGLKLILRSGGGRIQGMEITHYWVFLKKRSVNPSREDLL